MKFYINQTEVQVLVAPSVSLTKDETLDNVNVVLKANNQKNQYAPMQVFTIDFENGVDVLNFYILTDNVSVFSTNPLKYQHTLQIGQNIKSTQKHIVKNSQFTQPSKLQKIAYTGLPNIYDPTATSRFSLYYYNKAQQLYPQQWVENFELSTKDKISNAYIVLDCLLVKKDGIETTGIIDNPTHFYEIYAGVGATLKFVITNTTTNQSVNFYLDRDTTDFNKKIYADKNGTTIKSILQSLGSGKIIINYVGDSILGDYQIFAYGDSLTLNRFLTLKMQLFADIYYYSVYDILELLVQRQKLTYSLGNKKSVPFTLPTAQSNPELYNLLTHTIAPNFTFTQSTMFECLAEMYRLFDAIFSIDTNGVLDIDYFNDANEVITPTLTGINTSINEEKYNNGLISYYQDARVRKTFPSSQSYAPVRSSSFGVPTKEDHYFVVDSAIDQIERVYIKTSNTSWKALDYANNGSIQDIVFSGEFNVEITPFVFENSLYAFLSEVNPNDSLPDAQWFAGNVYQGNTLYFNRGSREISVGNYYTTSAGTSYSTIDEAIKLGVWRYFGIGRYGAVASYSNGRFKCSIPASQDFINMFMKCEYISSVDGRLENQSITNKYDGEMVVNQSSGAVDLYKLGLNMVGLSLKMGEPIRAVTHDITTWSQRIKTGQIIMDGNDKWVANVCTYTFFNNKIVGNIELSKNFNALALRTKLDREKRLTNISSELTLKSEDNFIDYAYFSSSTPTKTSQTTCIDYTNFLQMIIRTFDPSKKDKVDFATISTYTADGTSIAQNIFIPLTKYGAGTSLCFEITMYEPINAGNKTIKRSVGWFGEGYYTTTTPYTDTLGFFDKATINFYNSITARSFTNNFPQVENISVGTTEKLEFQIADLICYKQPNEVFALNYQIQFMPEDADQDFIGRAFIEENGAIIETIKLENLYVYYGTGTYSILDTRPIGNENDRILVNRENIYYTQHEANAFKLSFPLASAIPSTATCWALCNEKGEIYFSSNNMGAYETNKVSFYISLRKER